MFRSRHPPAFTALGVANGVFWGLTPTVGLQTIEIAATWVVGRKVFGVDSSLVQALIWVWVNNPLTMVPMYYVFYLTGLWLTGASGDATGYQAFLAIWDRPGVSWSELVRHVAATVGVPTLVGSIPYALLGAVVSYRWALAVIRRRRARLARAGL